MGPPYEPSKAHLLTPCGPSVGPVWTRMDPLWTLYGPSKELLMAFLWTPLWTLYRPAMDPLWTLYRPPLWTLYRPPMDPLGADVAQNGL